MTGGSRKPLSCPRPSTREGRALSLSRMYDCMYVTSERDFREKTLSLCIRCDDNGSRGKEERAADDPIEEKVNCFSSIIGKEIDQSGGTSSFPNFHLFLGSSFGSAGSIVR